MEVQPNLPRSVSQRWADRVEPIVAAEGKYELAPRGVSNPCFGREKTEATPGFLPADGGDPVATRGLRGQCRASLQLKFILYIRLLGGCGERI